MHETFIGVGMNGLSSRMSSFTRKGKPGFPRFADVPGVTNVVLMTVEAGSLFSTDWFASMEGEAVGSEVTEAISLMSETNML